MPPYREPFLRFDDLTMPEPNSTPSDGNAPYDGLLGISYASSERVASKKPHVLMPRAYVIYWLVVALLLSPLLYLSIQAGEWFR